MNRLHPDHLHQLAPGTRILFATVPADGHVNPLTGLAVYLQSIGCDVRWYTSTAYQQKIENLGIPFYPLVEALDLAASNIEEVFADRVRHKSMVAKLNYDMIHVFIKRGPEYFQDIKAIYADFPFDVVIGDLTNTALPLVKEVMGIPVIAAGIVPLTESSTDLPPAGLGMTPSDSAIGRVKQDILRFVADRFLFAKSTRYLRQMLATYGIDCPNTNIFDVMTKKATVLLQSGTPGFEYKRSDKGHNIHFVGPLLPHNCNKSAPWSHPKLTQYDKVILVTQGTVEKDPNKLIIPTLEAFKDTNCLVVVTTGGANTEELRTRFPHHNIIIEDFIPFECIMPYTDVYVTNGGYGGVLLGIQHGLPMVVAGVHEGKSEICARVGYFKLGINLRTEKPTPKQLFKSVSEVLDNGDYKTNVLRLKKEFAQYETGPLAASHIAQALNRKKKVHGHAHPSSHPQTLKGSTSAAEAAA
jgi:MGT family glycosyltransferase